MYTILFQNISNKDEGYGLENKDLVPSPKYLVCDTSYEYENDIDEKIHKFQGVYGSIIKTLTYKSRKD